MFSGKTQRRSTCVIVPRYPYTGNWAGSRPWARTLLWLQTVVL